MLKRILVFVVLLAAIALGFWQTQRLKETSQSPLPDLTAPTIATPGPLRASFSAPKATLTTAGTLTETNRHRAESGLPALTSNAKLAAAAEAKVNDMFTQQYFEHIGPDGRGPADWVEDTGYAYIAIGENLALGSFASDAELVEAWMASPGHRANILSKNFAEIGIAVGQGEFEGERTWLAVQTFGTPTSACPNVSSALRQEFTQKQDLSNQIESELTKTRARLDQLIAKHDQLLAEGNAKIEEGNRAAKRGDQEEAEKLWAEGETLQAQARELEPQIKERQDAYNSFVEQYNTLNNELIDLADQINTQVDQYNTCVARFGS